jgi:type I restriction enzyme S subunit
VRQPNSCLPVIRLENIGALKFNDQYRSYVAKEKYETIKKHTVYPADIVFSSFISERIRVALVPSHIREAVNKADCFCIRTNKIIIDHKYLACFLSTRTAYHQLVNEIHGATRPRINATQLKSCWIPYCSAEEQNQIVQEIESRLSVADKIEESIAQSLKQVEALRQSILKKAFSGKLVPQDPNDEPADKLLARILAERTAKTPLRSRRRPDSRPEALKRGPLV